MDPADVPSPPNGLTVDQRLQATSLAQGIAHQLKPLPLPLRRVVLEKVAWILGES